METPGGVTTYTYDALHRLETVGDPDSGVTRYFYDSVGNLVRTEFPNATVETRNYDDLNRLEFLETTGPGGVIVSFSYTLDATGRRIAVDEQDGRRVEYEYDALYRLVEERIVDSGAATPTRTIEYTYDAVGNRLTKDDSANGVTTYVYDNNDRLTTETTGGVTTAYTYDDNGNVLSRDDGTTHVHYFWSANNQLAGIDTDGDGTMDVEYRYDAGGSRVAEIRGGQETRFLIDDSRQFAEAIEEYRPDGNLVVLYVYGRDLISQKRGTTTSYYHVDGLGSTRALSDSAGRVTDGYTFDAFGVLVFSSGSTENRHLFTGEVRDPATGLDYLRARHLDPSLGRFLSRDVVDGFQESPLSLNKYIYAHADPVNGMDPSGQGLFTLLAVALRFVIDNVLRGINATIKATQGCRLAGLTDRVAAILAFVGFAGAVAASALTPLNPLVGTEIRWTHPRAANLVNVSPSSGAIGTRANTIAKISLRILKPPAGATISAFMKLFSGKEITLAYNFGTGALIGGLGVVKNIDLDVCHVTIGSVGLGVSGGFSVGGGGNGGGRVTFGGEINILRLRYLAPILRYDTNGGLSSPFFGVQFS